MKLTRRNFLRLASAAGVASAAASSWAGLSDSRRARTLRQLVRDTLRNPLPASATPTPDKWDDNRITFTWLGHSTVLINFYGVRILTDPVFGQRVGIDLGIGTLGPKRYIAPALRFNQLPEIDLVLLSHAHMDHMDLPTLARFKADQRVVTAHATGTVFQSTKLKPLAELGWGDATTFKTSRGDLRIEAFEVKHWGQRYPNDRARGYNGYVLRREGRALLFGGDTAMTPLFRNLRSGGPYEAAIMPVGAYNPWITNHCTPEEALQMADMAGARVIAPIHHSTFRLGDEPMGEPLERFEKALEPERDRIALKQIGETAVLT